MYGKSIVKYSGNKDFVKIRCFYPCFFNITARKGYFLRAVHYIILYDIVRLHRWYGISCR